MFFELVTKTVDNFVRLIKNRYYGRDFHCVIPDCMIQVVMLQVKEREESRENICKEAFKMNSVVYYSIYLIDNAENLNNQTIINIRNVEILTERFSICLNIYKHVFY